MCMLSEVSTGLSKPMHGNTQQATTCRGLDSRVKDRPNMVAEASCMRCQTEGASSAFYSLRGLSLFRHSANSAEAGSHMLALLLGSTVDQALICQRAVKPSSRLVMCLGARDPEKATMSLRAWRPKPSTAAWMVSEQPSVCSILSMPMATPGSCESLSTLCLSCEGHRSMSFGKFQQHTLPRAQGRLLFGSATCYMSRLGAAQQIASLSIAQGLQLLLQ